MAPMTLSYLLAATGRAVAIRCFKLLSRFPDLIDRIPSAKLRRQILVTALEDLKYDGIFSQATYAPWLSDRAFMALFNAVRGNTYVDIYRCHELWELVGQIGRLPAGDILEVGVWRGGTGALMAARCRQEALPGTIFLCDTFAGVVKAGGQDSAYVGGEHADTSQSLVEGLLGGLGLGNVQILKGIFPDETAHRIETRCFRLCHIDVDVYESALQTFEWVWPRLVPGGIVVFDDYGFYSCGGVTRLVNAMRDLPDRLVIYNLNAHAIVIKLAAPDRESSATPAAGG